MNVFILTATLVEIHESAFCVEVSGKEPTKVWAQPTDRVKETLKAIPVGTMILMEGYVRYTKGEDGAKSPYLEVYRVSSELSVNRVFLQGYLGQDPEMKFLGDGETPKTRISMCTKRGKDPDPDWHYVDFIGRVAVTIADYFKKGTPILVEGRLNFNTFTSRKYGKEMIGLEVAATQFHFALKEKEKESTSTADTTPPGPKSAPKSNGKAPVAPSYDEIPF